MTAPLLGGRVFQLAFVVRDLEVALERYSSTLAAAPWRVFDISSETFGVNLYRGRLAEFTVGLALNDVSPQLELIQPRSGESAWAESLRERGEGFHHVGVLVDSVDEAVERMAAVGCETIQSGRGFGLDGDGAYAYFDAVDRVGCVLEAVEPFGAFIGPDRVWERPT